MKNVNYKMILLGCIPVIYIGVLVAPYVHLGLFELVIQFNKIISNPFNLTICKDTLRSVIVCILVYAFVIGLVKSNDKNYRRKEEYGSATWGDAKMLNKKMSDDNYLNNKIFTQNVRMSLNMRHHMRNLNTIVIGGSGAGKTRFYGKPNIMQCNSSFVITDPKGELLRDTGYLLEKEGYEIRVLDLIHMEKSHGYNPFKYIHDDNDILKLITNLIKNTTPKGTQETDPFWTKSETALLQAICLYLYHEAPKDEQNFTMVMEMINAAEVKEEDEEYQSPLDELFERLEMRKPGSLAYKQYSIYKKAAGKTAKSILISVGVRLAAFNFDSIASLTSHDELELDQIGFRKTALFAIIPDVDKTFNFLVGMMYTQLFQTLFIQAETTSTHGLPIPVHIIFDEFANIALPDDFETAIAIMRSKNINVSIILQSLSQLKALYKDTWEVIFDCCDEFLYLGGNSQSTHKFLSEYLGKDTLDTNTYGKSSGRSGNYSTNYQQTGRDLLTPDEVRLLDNDYALFFVRSEAAIMDKKYDIMKHPNIKYTSDGGMPIYEHGKTDIFIDNWQDIMVSDNEYEILSGDEMELYFKKLEENKNEEKNN